MDSSIVQTLVIALLAVAPVLFMSIWAWVKAHAAESEAKWDDEAVAFVEKIAQQIVDANKPTV